MTSEDIKRILSQKHIDDVFVTECHTGRNGKIRIMDAWAMKKSWAHPVTYGYEIKVSRSDFLGDEKWTEYLPYCNRFSFVCPNGLIQKEEIASGIGLIYVSKNSNRLITVRKAAHRFTEDTSLGSVYKYILMSRTKISKPTMYIPEFEKDKIKWFENWLENKKYNEQFGRIVGLNLKKAIKEKISEVEYKNHLLKRKMDDIEDRLKEIGLSSNMDNLMHKLKALTRTPLSEIDRSINHASNAISRLQQAVKEIKELIS